MYTGDDSLGDIYGNQFEIKFLNVLIGRSYIKGKDIYRDCFWGNKIIQIVKSDHFNITSSKKIVKLISKYYSEYKTIPFYDTLKELVTKEYPLDRKNLFDFLSDIENIPVENEDFIKKSAQDFIQGRNLFSEIEKIKYALDKKEITSYEQIADRVKKNLSMNIVDNVPTIFSKKDFLLSEEEFLERNPIPTGFGYTFDEILNGGISRGELALVIAGLKVGKSTMAAILADAAAKDGKTVLIIYFEGTEEQLRAKFRARWSGISINEASNKKNFNYIKSACDQQLRVIENSGGKIILKKFPVIGTKVPHIESFMDELENIYKIKIDMLILDYLENVEPEGKYTDDFKGEKEVMRGIESLVSEDRFNCACWCFTQGNRGSINSDEIDILQMGGSIKKAQIGHVIIGLGKTKDQRKNKMATISIIGSRVGDDGIVFKDIIFDNARVTVKIEDENMVRDFEKERVKK
jgi:replicative DNA helicase